MKKETLIRLVVGLGDVCLAIALFIVGICFDWFVMLFPERDCACDHYVNSLLSNRVDSNLSFSCLVRYHKQEIAVKPKP